MWPTGGTIGISFPAPPLKFSGTAAAPNGVYPVVCIFGCIHGCVGGGLGGYVLLWLVCCALVCLVVWMFARVGVGVVVCMVGVVIGCMYSCFMVVWLMVVCFMAGNFSFTYCGIHDYFMAGYTIGRSWRVGAFI